MTKKQAQKVQNIGVEISAVEAKIERLLAYRAMLKDQQRKILTSQPKEEEIKQPSEEEKEAQSKRDKQAFEAKLQQHRKPLSTALNVL